MNTITWNEVKKTHQTVAGIYCNKEEVVSILVNINPNSPYPNKVTKDKITYFFGSNTQFWAVKRLMNIVGKNKPIRVFQKLGVNKWLDLGCWVATQIGDAEEDGFWPIFFKPAK